MICIKMVYEWRSFSARATLWIALGILPRTEILTVYHGKIARDSSEISEISESFDTFNSFRLFT